MKIKLIAGLLAVVLALAAAAAAAQPGEPPAVTMKGSLLVDTGSAFTAGTTSGTVVLPTEAAPLRLAATAGRYQSRGLYLSPVIRTAPFRELILSWNADTPAGTAITIEAQVLVGQKWSEWFSWGTWGGKSASAAKLAGQTAKMDIDTLTISGGQKAIAVRYRLTLTSADSRVTPTVRLVALTVRDHGDSGVSPPASPAAGWQLGLAVPAYAQAKRDPRIASRICSPTSLSMVMNYWGVAVSPEEAAWGSYDHRGDLFGNWSFNAAYAGKHGFTAYVAYLDSLADLKQEIAQGFPVVVAVWYRSSQAVNQAFPVLHGAPIDYTDGHLVVVRGFKVKDGKEYVLVNDPAGGDEAGVYREYAAGEFAAAWVKVAYIIRPPTQLKK
jgi:uncharacterized protein YvpB